MILAGSNLTQRLDKSQTNDWGEYAAAPHTHERAWDLLARHLPPPASILDLPCGAGRFARQLATAGYSVTAADVAHVEPFRFDIANRVLMDFNRGLLFSDAQFDGVVSIEGIEHLENPSQFLRDLARVIRPGGTIVLTTPNPDSFRSRRLVFIRGYHRFFHAVNDTVKDSGHLLPIDMVFFRGACRRAGLEIVETAVNEPKGRSVVTEFIRPLLQRRLPAYMRGPVPFYGDVILYVLRKPVT